MPYCAQADIEKKLPLADLIEFTDDDNLGSVNTTILNAAIESADELIDAYVGKVKSVPLSPVPGLIKNISVSLVVYNLDLRKGFSNESRAQSASEARKTLELIATRKITLGDDEATLAKETTEGGPISSTASKTQEFNKDSMAGF